MVSFTKALHLSKDQHACDMHKLECLPNVMCYVFDSVI